MSNVQFFGDRIQHELKLFSHTMDGAEGNRNLNFLKFTRQWLAESSLQLKKSANTVLKVTDSSKNGQKRVFFSFGIS